MLVGLDVYLMIMLGYIMYTRDRAIKELLRTTDKVITDLNSVYKDAVDQYNKKTEELNDYQQKRIER